MNSLFVQFQDMSGWNTAITLDVDSHPTLILNAMRDVERMYSGRRVRCVDENNRIVDIL